MPLPFSILKSNLTALVVPKCLTYPVEYKRSWMYASFFPIYAKHLSVLNNSVYSLSIFVRNNISYYKTWEFARFKSFIGVAKLFNLLVKSSPYYIFLHHHNVCGVAFGFKNKMIRIFCYSTFFYSTFLFNATFYIQYVLMHHFNFLAYNTKRICFGRCNTFNCETLYCQRITFERSAWTCGSRTEYTLSQIGLQHS